MTQYTAVVLVLMFATASVRTLICESTCVEPTSVAQSERCHDASDHAGPTAAVSDGSYCEHPDGVFTLPSTKLTTGRTTLPAGLVSTVHFSGAPTAAQRHAYSPPLGRVPTRTLLVTLRI